MNQPLQIVQVQVTRLPRGTVTPPKDAIERAPRPQIGDKIEVFLTSYGVTKEWWSEFKAQHGLPRGCKCPERQAWFNKLGESLPGFAGIAVKLLEFLTRKP